MIIQLIFRARRDCDRNVSKPDCPFQWTVKKRNVEHFYEHSLNVIVTVTFSAKYEDFL